MSKKDTIQEDIFTRRAFLIGGLQGSLLLLLAGRLTYLQVFQSENLARLAEKNRTHTYIIPPLRGRILDRFGGELATNKQNLRAAIVAEKAGNLQKTLQDMGRILKLPKNQQRHILRKLAKMPKFVPLVVKEYLSWEEFATLNMNLPRLSGLELDTKIQRYYPRANSFAHVVGYVVDSPKVKVSGWYVGRSGIEKQIESRLKGKTGVRRVENNAYGRFVRELDRQGQGQGEDVTLSVDTAIQQSVVKELKNQRGSVTVMDIHNGEILAMACTPSFNPNLFHQGITTAQWRELQRNPATPLINKAIAGQYPPGSVFKLVTAMAALEDPDISPQKKFTCPGFYVLGRRQFHCWKKEGHGIMNLHQALKHSCDTYFYNIARNLGVDALEAMAHKMGLGHPTGIELPGEKKGLIPGKVWKKQQLAQPWYQGETVIMGIGQGYVLSTPLQLATMTAWIANGGYKVTPTLFKTPAQKSLKAAKLTVQPASIAFLQKAMEAVVNEPQGTAYHVRWRGRHRPKGALMAGKTGTAQVRRISTQEREKGVRDNKDLPTQLRDHALFVGFAPVKNPKYAISVVIEHGGSGSKKAAPIAANIMKTLLKLTA